jgi:hypothetical protein
MPPRNINDPQHWRDRAAKLRALARTMPNPNAAILMIDLAVDYEKRAETAAIEANRKKPPPRLGGGKRRGADELGTHIFS